jgi:hypothetical protein
VIKQLSDRAKEQYDADDSILREKIERCFPKSSKKRKSGKKSKSSKKSKSGEVDENEPKLSKYTKEEFFIHKGEKIAKKNKRSKDFKKYSKILKILQKNKVKNLQKTYEFLSNDQKEILLKDDYSPEFVREINADIKDNPNNYLFKPWKKNAIDGSRSNKYATLGFGEYAYDSNNSKLASRYGGKGREMIMRVVWENAGVDGKRMYLNKVRRRHLSDYGINILLEGKITNHVRQKTGRGKIYVLQSSFAAATYLQYDDLILHYLKEKSDVSKIQMAVDFNAAQFIADNAIENNINYLRHMGEIRGINLLDDGHLEISDNADVDKFSSALKNMVVLGIQGIHVRGIDDNNHSQIIDKSPHKVDFIYAGSPMFESGRKEKVTQIALMAIFGQYVAALRIAVKRKNCDVYLMPLGLDSSPLPIDYIKFAMCEAMDYMRYDLEKEQIRVFAMVSASDDAEELMTTNDEDLKPGKIKPEIKGAKNVYFDNATNLLIASENTMPVVWENVGMNGDPVRPNRIQSVHLKDMGITQIVGEIMESIQTKTERHKVYVLPSQLNAAEYSDKNVNTKNYGLKDYKDDNTAGPRGQLAVDHAAAQFILTNAANKENVNGINNVRRMGNIRGINLVNGYLNVNDNADVKEFSSKLNQMTILGIKDIRVKGLDPTLRKEINLPHSVDLIYASAVPYGTYGNSSHPNVLDIATMTIFGQYVASLRIACRRPDCDVYLLPLGGGFYNVPHKNIKFAMYKAVEEMRQELTNSRINVYVLAYQRNLEEIAAFT